MVRYLPDFCDAMRSLSNSGEQYSAVPTNEYRFAVSETSSTIALFNIFAEPKSVSFI